MKRRTKVVSLRTMQRRVALERLRVTRMEGVVRDATAQIKTLTHTLQETDRIRARVAKADEIEARLERIRSIVEEIIEFHGLVDPVRQELFAAVHQAASNRIARTFFSRDYAAFTASQGKPS